MTRSQRSLRVLIFCTALLIGARPHDDAERSVERAIVLHQARRYGEAAEELNAAIRTAPNWHYPALLLARIYGDAHLLNRAIDAVTRAMRLIPRGAAVDRSSATKLLAELEAARGNVQAARHACANARALEPAADDVDRLAADLDRFETADAALASGRWQEAAAAFASLLLDRPSWLNVYERLASAQLHLNDPLAARATLTRAISLCPIRSVFLVGSFSLGHKGEWDRTANAMEDRDNDGVWTTRLHLEPGTYHYKFLVNGNDWFSDPSAAEDEILLGGRASVLRISGSKARWRLFSFATFPTDPLFAHLQTLLARIEKDLAPGDEDAPRESARIPVTFRFRPPAGTQSVQLAGSFNGWANTEHGAFKQDEAYLLKDGGADGLWILTIDLPAGDYPYKFVLDGHVWMADPEADAYVNDGFGGHNGVIFVGRSVPRTPVELRFQPADYFEADADGGFVVYRPSTIALVGDFNHWNKVSHLLEDLDGDGVWTVSIDVPPGRYRYNFLVDETNWFADPLSAAFERVELGTAKYVEVDRGKSSVVVIPEGGSGPLVFRFRPPRLRCVAVAGSMNGWNRLSHQLAGPASDGSWRITLHVVPGEYEYKFVVNDVMWLSDIKADRFKPDPFGGQNSVLTVR
ncbi:MAG: hypothetical protein HYV63_30495 [Candidatus Schekmanbacteria bacterium]|nr:hypothetical protein [Candidatus Schekmanbacteria bacterium]